MLRDWTYTEHASAGPRTPRLDAVKEHSPPFVPGVQAGKDKDILDLRGIGGVRGEIHHAVNERWAWSGCSIIERITGDERPIIIDRAHSVEVYGREAMEGGRDVGKVGPDIRASFRYRADALHRLATLNGL